MATSNQNGRIRSIDVVRGAVMVLMALDHVRVYSGIPAGGPTAGVFLTRWITNFCAPAFVFFAGSSIFLHGERLNDRVRLARWLVVRGRWLVLLELTFLRLAWTFNADVATTCSPASSGCLGWCMILMATARATAPRRKCGDQRGDYCGTQPTRAWRSTVLSNRYCRGIWAGCGGSSISAAASRSAATTNRISGCCTRSFHGSA